jgi:hypothetical protein
MRHLFNLVQGATVVLTLGRDETQRKPRRPSASSLLCVRLVVYLPPVAILSRA